MIPMATQIQSVFGGREVDRSGSVRSLADGAQFLIWAFLSVGTGANLFGISRDYYEYVVYYDSIPSTFSLIDTRFEPGFHAVAWVFKNWLGADLSTLILVLSSLSLAIKFLLFRRNLQYPLPATLIYTVIFFPIHEYTQYRVGISLAFGYWALHVMLKRRFWCAALLFILSFTFHYSSIIILIIGLGGLTLPSRLAMAGVAVIAIVSSEFIPQAVYLLHDLLNLLNPLSDAYLANKAAIDSTTLLSVNNLLLIAAIACYIYAGYFSRSRYHALFLTMTIACLIPIALLSDAPIIAERSKEVLFMSVIFLAFRSRLRASDVPGLTFLLAMAGLLGYLSVREGVIFS